MNQTENMKMDGSLNAETAKEFVRKNYAGWLVTAHLHRGACLKIEMTSDYEIFESIYPSSNSWTRDCETLATFQNVDLFDDMSYKKFGANQVIAYEDDAEYEKENGRQATREEKEEANVDIDESAVILDMSYREMLETIAENMDSEDEIERIEEKIEGIESEQ